ncbi:MAG: HD domain-containing protein [Candidatus Dojkabacteria bacterium]|nr:HD domain-containing protein [Candidatus Dojkabacteria bacterium]
MKTLYIKDLQKGQVFDSETFAIFDKKQSEDKNGNPYYDLVIGDKTGRIPAKIWSTALPKVDRKAITAGKVVKLSGKVDEYRGAPQLVIYSLESVDESSLEEFIESSEFDADEMYAELLEEVEKAEDEEIKAVLLEILNDTEIKRKLKYWPASTFIHHGFRSGFLQHILEMIAISKGLERFYPNVDYSILLAGIILHDLGKLDEIDATNISLPYSKKGNLLGHVYLGTELFNSYAKAKMDEDKLIHIKHLILSHHGKYEYGSPVNPATTEALMLSYIDETSAKPRSAYTIQSQMEDDEDFSKRIWYLENVKNLEL